MNYIDIFNGYYDKIMLIYLFDIMMNFIDIFNGY